MFLFYFETIFMTEAIAAYIAWLVKVAGILSLAIIVFFVVGVIVSFCLLPDDELDGGIEQEDLHEMSTDEEGEKSQNTPYIIIGLIAFIIITAIYIVFNI